MFFSTKCVFLWFDSLKSATYMEMALYINRSSLQFVWSLNFFHRPNFKPSNANTFYFLVQYRGGKTWLVQNFSRFCEIHPNNIIWISTRTAFHVFKFFYSVFMCQPAGANGRLKEAIASSEAMSEHAQKQAARYDLLLPEDAG